MTGHGKGFGKVILFGEHIVVYGYPAIVSAMGNVTTAVVVDGKEGLTIVDNRPETPGYKEKKLGERDRALGLMFKFMNIDTQKTPLKITLGGNLVCASGKGSSAALATSIARALNDHFSLGLNDDQINEIAYEGEKGSAGTPSGIDNTASTYGGLLVFKKNLEGGPNQIERMKIKQPVEIVLANTGITQETKEVVSDIRSKKEAEPEKYDKLFSDYMKIFDEAKEAIGDFDMKKLGSLMDEKQDILREMTLSCPEIEKIIKAGKTKGALGGKLTGTGRGGSVILLTPGKELQEKVLKAVKESGFDAIKTFIGAK
ncbi:MAG: mevalonate kinase [Candidatus Aenigmarchaeota archaeon]|nr:mevalonate kinase [Candidatus Aenigmarchaeota archaeon]